MVAADNGLTVMVVEDVATQPEPVVAVTVYVVVEVGFTRMV